MKNENLHHVADDDVDMGKLSVSLVAKSALSNNCAYLEVQQSRILLCY